MNTAEHPTHSYESGSNFNYYNERGRSTHRITKSIKTNEADFHSPHRHEQGPNGREEKQGITWESIQEGGKRIISSLGTAVVPGVVFTLLGFLGVSGELVGARTIIQKTWPDVRNALLTLNVPPPRDIFQLVRAMLAFGGLTHMAFLHDEWIQALTEFRNITLEEIQKRVYTFLFWTIFNGAEYSVTLQALKAQHYPHPEATAIIATIADEFFLWLGIKLLSNLPKALEEAPKKQVHRMMKSIHRTWTTMKTGMLVNLVALLTSFPLQQIGLAVIKEIPAQVQDLNSPKHYSKIAKWISEHWLLILGGLMIAVLGKDHGQEAFKNLKEAIQRPSIKLNQKGKGEPEKENLIPINNGDRAINDILDKLNIDPDELPPLFSGYYH